MAIFQKRNTTAYIKTQTAKGSPAAVGDANAIDILADLTPMQPKGDTIDRGLVRGSRYPSKKTIAGKWSEGSYPLELRGSGLAGTAPEFAPLLESLLGTLSANAADTVDVASGAVDGFACAEAIPVGGLCRVDVSVAMDGSEFEIRKIASRSGSGPYTYIVDTNFTRAPGDGAAVAAGVNALHLGTESEVYLTVDQYLDGLRLLSADAVAESLTIGVTEREVIKGTFALRGLTPTESAATDPNSPIFDDSDPLIGTDCNVKFAGSSLNMKSLELNLTTRRARGGINTAGYGELPWMSKFEAGITLTPWVEDGAPFSALFAGTLFDVEMVKGVTAGNILALYVTDAQYDSAEINDEDGDYQWNTPATITGGVVLAFF